MAAVTYGVFPVRRHANKVAQKLEGQLQSASDTLPLSLRQARASEDCGRIVRLIILGDSDLRLGRATRRQERQAEASTRKPSKSPLCRAGRDHAARACHHRDELLVGTSN